MKCALGGSIQHLPKRNFRFPPNFSFDILPRLSRVLSIFLGKRETQHSGARHRHLTGEITMARSENYGGCSRRKNTHFFMKLLGHLLVLTLALAMITAAAVAQDERDEVSAQIINVWNSLETGLEFGIFRAPQPSESGDSLIRVLRIDPAHFEFRLLNASARLDRESFTAKEWCEQHNLIAAINASMYQTDYLTSVSLMRTKGHANNSHLTKDKSILAFHPLNAKLPQITILDRQCDNFDEWMPKYATLVQSIRMISCKGKNVWRQNTEKRWSIASIGTDQAGRVLFIHARSAYSASELNDMLLKLPLQISRAMYVEGGSQAQLYVKSGEYECQLVGTHGTGGFNPYNGAQPIPNVVGILRR